MGLSSRFGQARFEQAFAPVAQLFGESPEQLVNDLQSGQTSLSALAQSKGISQSDQIDAITQGLQDSSANGTSNLSGAQPPTVATSAPDAPERFDTSL